jgi:hypothetical protein
MTGIDSDCKKSSVFLLLTFDILLDLELFVDFLVDFFGLILNSTLYYKLY